MKRFVLTIAALSLLLSACGNDNSYDEPRTNNDLNVETIVSDGITYKCITFWAQGIWCERAEKKEQGE